VKILELLRKNPEMTLVEVAASVGKTVRAIELASSKMVKTGLLKHRGSKKAKFKGHIKARQICC